MRVRACLRALLHVVSQSWNVYHASVRAHKFLQMRTLLHASSYVQANELGFHCMGLCMYHGRGGTCGTAYESTTATMICSSISLELKGACSSDSQSLSVFS